MDRTELREKLEEHLDFLRDTAKVAAADGYYSTIAELSKQYLETVKLLDDYS